MALIPDVVGDADGTATAARAAANGDTIIPGKDAMLVIINGSGAPITATVTAVKPCSQGGLHNAVAIVAAGATALVGPIDERYANSSTGLAVVNYSATATVTVYVARI